MRNMSFMLTTEQIKARTKTVTRRLGWDRLQPGDTVQAVVKGMGLKKGEKVQPLGVIRIVDTYPEPLNCITQEDCIREGFPDMTPQQFVAMFCKHNKCDPGAWVNRIEFEYVD